MEDLKRRIKDLIDGSRDPWRKAVFYSNPVVSDILTKLYERWEENGRKGIPLDYATMDELETLYRFAKAAVDAPEGEALRSFIEEYDAYGVQTGVKKRKGFFKRIFSKRR